MFADKCKHWEKVCIHLMVMPEMEEVRLAKMITSSFKVFLFQYLNKIGRLLLYGNYIPG